MLLMGVFSMESKISKSFGGKNLSSFLEQIFALQKAKDVLILC